LKLMVVGGGGREHALLWKLRQDNPRGEFFSSPGNAGMSQLSHCLPYKAEDIVAIADFAQKENLDFTVIGPEAPLVEGIVDEFQKRGLKVFGPSARAALLEGSKVFAKLLMRKHSIPTAEFEVFPDPTEARAYIDRIGTPIVVKADGLCAGKGSYICRNKEEAYKAIEEIMEQRIFGAAGNRVVIEEMLEGEEASFMLLSDGDYLLPLQPAQDYKRANDNDEGPNTGGMGSYSPVPAFPHPLQKEVIENIAYPTIRAMQAEGTPFVGLLYLGLMLTKEGPKVLEFNVRFGDPETQCILPRMKGDLLEALIACQEGRLREIEMGWREEKCICVVLASRGYPGNYETGKEIKGLEEVEKMNDCIVFHAGTRKEDGKVLTAGGRVLGVVGLGKSFREARQRTYKAIEKISFENMFYRRDIAKRVEGKD